MTIEFNSPYVGLVRAILNMADAMDAGDREKAQAYLDQADRLVQEITARSGAEQDG